MSPTEIAVVSRLVAQQLAEFESKLEADARSATTSRIGGTTFEKQISAELSDQLFAVLKDALRRSMVSRDARMAELEARVTATEQRLREGSAA